MREKIALLQKQNDILKQKQHEIDYCLKYLTQTFLGNKYDRIVINFSTKIIKFRRSNNHHLNLCSSIRFLFFIETCNYINMFMKHEHRFTPEMIRNIENHETSIVINIEDDDCLMWCV